MRFLRRDQAKPNTLSDHKIQLKGIKKCRGDKKDDRMRGGGGTGRAGKTQCQVTTPNPKVLKTLWVCILSLNFSNNLVTLIIKL